MKKISILFAIIMLFGSFAMASSGDSNDGYQTGYDDGYDEGYYAGKNSVKATTPVVKIVESLETPEVKAGEKFEIKPKFKNDSKYLAHNVSISPIFDEQGVLVYERPLVFSTNDALGTKKELQVSFTLSTSSNAKEGTYPIRFKVEYKNAQGEIFTRTETAYFKIVQEKKMPILNVSNVMINPNSYQYGSLISLGFDINNIGGSEAKNVEVKLSGFSTDTIMPINSRDYNYIEKIEGAEEGSKSSSRQTFEMKISPEIEVRDVELKANIKYTAYDDKEYTTEKSFYITNITPKPKESGEKEEKKDEDKLPKPKIIVSNYSISSNNISAGEEFDFSFNLKNTSKEKPIRNIKITISSFEGSFIITNGSNTFYIEGMDRNEIISRHINLKAKQDLASNSYAVYIDTEYEDYNGTEYTAKETIHIPVTEYSKLVINNINTEDAFLGNPTNVSFEYVNMGKATISNLIATVAGDIKAVQETSYIGNIQAGNSDYYDIEVIPLNEGKNNGTLTLTYEDSSGKKNSVSKEFDFMAYAEESINDSFNNIPDIPETPSEEEQSFEVWQIILAGIGAFLVLFIVSRLITKKIILKKFEEEL